MGESWAPPRLCKLSTPRGSLADQETGTSQVSWRWGEDLVPGALVWVGIGEEAPWPVLVWPRSLHHSRLTIEERFSL